MSDYNEKIKRGLILYLKEVEGVEGEITNAWLTSDIDHEKGWGGGCDTCGYGEDECEVTVKTDINYALAGASAWNYGYKSVNMDPLNFFPRLLEYIDRAN